MNRYLSYNYNHWFTILGIRNYLMGKPATQVLWALYSIYHIISQQFCGFVSHSALYVYLCICMYKHWFAVLGARYEQTITLLDLGKDPDLGDLRGVFWEKWSLSFLNFHSNEDHSIMKAEMFSYFLTLYSMFLGSIYSC